MNRQQLDPTHSFSVADAIKFGSVEKALIVKEILNIQLYKLDHGTAGWVYFSGSALAAKFPYIKQRTIERYMVELVQGGHLEETVQNKISYDRTKSYRLADVTIEQTLRQNGESTRQTDGPVRQSGGPKRQNGGTIPSPTSPTNTHKQNDKNTGDKPPQDRASAGTIDRVRAELAKKNPRFSPKPKQNEPQTSPQTAAPARHEPTPPLDGKRAQARAGAARQGTKPSRISQPVAMAL